MYKGIFENIKLIWTNPAKLSLMRITYNLKQFLRVFYFLIGCLIGLASVIIWWDENVAFFLVDQMNDM